MRAQRLSPRIERLTLTGNEIGDEGASALSEALLSLTQLETLHLSSNHISPASRSAVTAAFRGHSLNL